MKKTPIEELLILHFNDVLKRSCQLDKWKKKPSAERRRKELMKVTDKYAQLIKAEKLVNEFATESISIKFEFKEKGKKP